MKSIVVGGGIIGATHERAALDPGSMVTAGFAHEEVLVSHV